MSTTVVTIPNIEVRLTVEQLTEAVRQLDSTEKAKVARALIDSTLNSELTQLITELYSQPPVEDISDDAIRSEIQSVRQQRP